VSLCPEFGEQAHPPEVSKEKRETKRKNLKNGKSSYKNRATGRRVSHRQRLLQIYKMKIGASKSYKYLVLKDGKMFVCKLCGEKFAFSSGIHNHINVHRGRTKCTLCERVLGSLVGLKHHMRVSHKM
jgi:hypothetical protein